MIAILRVPRKELVLGVIGSWVSQATYLKGLKFGAMSAYQATK